MTIAGGAIVLIIVFFLLLAIGAPVSVGIALATVGALLVSIAPDAALVTVAQRVATGTESFVLLAIPFFVLAGQIMNRGGIARRIVDFAAACVGTLPGGLAMVNILAAMIFGAISGSAAAAATAVGGTLGPRMADAGYDPRYSAAVNISSATTGLIIPPSNILIVYSLASGGLSIAALFVAGYLPGLLLGLCLMLVAGVIAAKRGYRASERIPLGETFRRFLGAAPSLGLIVVVIGGIIGGVFTATEAAAIAVAYATILAAIYREIRPRDVFPLLRDAAATTAVVLLLVSTSFALSWVLAFENLPQQISDGLLNLSENPLVLLLLINAILLVVGTFMDMTPAVLIFTPIFLPVVTGMDIDPIHFGIMMVLNLCVGLCTPPVGTVLFIGCGVANVSIQSVLRFLLPMYAAMVGCLALVTAFPQISLWLPQVFGLH